MAKKESSFVNMVVTLLVISLVASTSLGYIYELTKEPIEAAKLAKKLQAIDAVVPAYDNQPVDEMYKIPGTSPGDTLEFYPARKNNELVGTAVRTYSKNGYGGIVYIMVGITPEGIIQDTKVVEHKETPGLGTKMADPKFSDQFKGMDPSNKTIKVKKDNGDVDAITAATISSRAFCEATQLAVDTYKKGGRK